MAFRTYLDKLKARGGLRVVDREVSGRYELAAVTSASQRESDRALLFRKVAGSKYPAVTNIYGSRARLCEMIGAANGSFCRRWAEIMRKPARDLEQVSEPEDLVELKLSDLPQITYFERDAGPYITAGVFVAKEPDSGVANLSFHRGQIMSDTELRVRLGSSHDLTKYQTKAEARGQALEAAILLGAPPAAVLAAAATLPYDEDELLVAGKLQGAPLKLRRCRTVNVDVPADTEIVIEGRILPNMRRPEGPFGEFMGFYVPREDNHVFEVTAVVARPNPLYHAVVCGSPEDMRLLELAVATRVYEALMAANLRGVVDVACVPMIMSTVIKIDQQYEGHARQVAMTAVGANHDWSKAVIVVDDDVDITDFNDVWWAYLTRGRADQRAIVLSDIPGFYRDPNKDYWGRLIVDATAPFGRKAEFERKKIPGIDRIKLGDYLA